MRKNLYVTCGDLKYYDGWEVIQVIPRVVNNADYCMAVITKDDSNNKANDENLYKAMYEDYKSRCEKAINKIQYIIDYGFDYDGFNTVESLKGLIDMLVDYAKQSKDILQNGSDFNEQ